MRTLTGTPTSLANVTPERDAAIQKACSPSCVRCPTTPTGRLATVAGARARPVVRCESCWRRSRVRRTSASATCASWPYRPGPDDEPAAGTGAMGARRGRLVTGSVVCGGITVDVVDHRGQMTGARRRGDPRHAVAGRGGAHRGPRSGETADAPPTRAVRMLTAQQLQITRLVVDGVTDREVAARLYLSTRTADHHMRDIFSRLGIRSRVELAKVL
jgi:DNA-binding CsgD family transcriptional regulator